MFKRLVAGATVAMLATTVVSAVPALSVDAASKKVDLKELYIHPKQIQFKPKQSHWRSC